MVDRILRRDGRGLGSCGPVSLDQRLSFISRFVLSAFVSDCVVDINYARVSATPLRSSMH